MALEKGEALLGSIRISGKNKSGGAAGTLYHELCDGAWRGKHDPGVWSEPGHGGRAAGDGRDHGACGGARP